MPTNSLFPQGPSSPPAIASSSSNLHGHSHSLGSLEMDLGGPSSSSNGRGGSNGVHQSQDGAMQLALELAMLQQQNGGSSNGAFGDAPSPQHHNHHHNSLGLSHSHPFGDNPLMHPFGRDPGAAPSLNHSSISALNGAGGSLEDLKTGRRSQNMTECVPVPTSEHVAEIVGRQGKS